MQIIDYCNNKSVTCDLANLTFITNVLETVLQKMISHCLFLCAPCHSPNISGPVHTTLPRRNFKMQLSFWIVFEKNWVREIAWLSSRHHFRKTHFWKCFPSIRKQKPVVFKFLPFKERFRKATFSWWTGVDGRPNRRIKAAFLNFSNELWTGPHTDVFVPPWQMKRSALRKPAWLKQLRF